MLRYLNRNIGYDPTEQRGVELSRLNRKEWGVDLCAVNELHLRNWVMEIFFHRFNFCLASKADDGARASNALLPTKSIFDLS